MLFSMQRQFIVNLENNYKGKKPPHINKHTRNNRREAYRALVIIYLQYNMIRAIVQF